MKTAIIKRKNLGAAFAYLVLSLFTVLMVFPFLWMLSSSFKDYTQILQMKFLDRKSVV